MHERPPSAPFAPSVASAAFVASAPVVQADVAEIRQSPLFDALWYLTTYPDVVLLKMDPAEHYLWIGARIGRNPSPHFDSGVYMVLNADVRAAGMNPLLHYLRFGKQEGRKIRFPDTRAAGALR